MLRYSIYWRPLNKENRVSQNKGGDAILLINGSEEAFFR